MHQNQHTIFNEKLADFILRMIDVKPNISDFRIFLKSCELITNIDYKLPMQIFKYCITDPYSDKIMARDESFFLNESYDEYGDIMNVYGYSFDLVNKFKGLWGTYSSDEKKLIWNYFKVLCSLSANSQLDLLKSFDMQKNIYVKST